MAKVTKTLTISDLSREMDRDPKVVRAKLRRLKKKGAVLPSPIPGTQWTFKFADKQQLVQLIEH